MATPPKPLHLGTAEETQVRATALATRLGAEVTVLADATAAVEALRAGELGAVVLDAAQLQAPDAGLTLAAVPKRADARDAVCASGTHTLEQLAAGARVGVDSPRRCAQLRLRYPALVPVDVTGDAAAQLALLATDDAAARLDAVVLSAAELEARGLADAITQRLDLDTWPPDAAQGAVVVVTRRGDEKRVAKLDHTTSRLTVTAERAVATHLADLEAPLAVTAMLDDGLLFVSARAYALDGSHTLTASHAAYPEDSANPAGELAERAADELRAAGVAELATRTAADAAPADAATPDAAPATDSEAAE